MSPRLKAITLVALVACTPTRRRTPDDTLVVAIETPIRTVDPRFAVSNYDSKLVRLVAPGLTTVDTPNAEPRLELAAAIDHVDPLTVDVTLRADARFSDGSAVTADDVARSYGSAIDDRCGSTSAKNLGERFQAIEPRGDKVVRFHLWKPLGTFVTDIDFGVISYHGVAPGACSPPRVIGAGPYVLRELTSFAAKLDANPYYPTPPRLPHVEIRFVRDASARILMLVGGSIDLLQNAARPDLIDDLAGRPRVHVEAAPSVILTYLMMNNDDPVLRDLRVREAIALALDRPAIIAAKFGGRAVLATGLLPPSHWAYEPDVPRWNHDPARARALLDQAGLPPDAGGVRLHLVYKTSADDFRVAVARVIAAQLAEVGIEIEIRPFEFATFFADIKRGNFQIATMQTAEITEPDYYFAYFNSSRIPDAKDPDANNRWRYRSAEVDRLTEAGRRETDPAARKQIYSQVQRIVARDLPIIPLWHEDNVVLSNVDVQGYRIVPNARFSGLISATKSH
ncbi:MAG TPA: ABC transporter substrate-binding protein [Kofleriaceae bacterium]|nr:ABC transporter substrate-binding protein [Kofleriaceae bacterium]